MAAPTVVPLQASGGFEGLGDNRDELRKTIRFTQYGQGPCFLRLAADDVCDVPRIQNEGNGAKLSAGFHLAEKFPPGHNRHVIIGYDEVHVLALHQPRQRGGPMFGFFADIPMVLQKELQGLSGHRMIIHEENTFHEERPLPERRLESSLKKMPELPGLWQVLSLEQVYCTLFVE